MIAIIVQLLTDQSADEDNRREVPEYDPEKLIFNEYNPNLSISPSVLPGGTWSFPTRSYKRDRRNSSEEVARMSGKKASAAKMEEASKMEEAAKKKEASA